MGTATPHHASQKKSLMPKLFQKVSVVGLGYIGLPTAAVIASKGVSVLGVDVQPHVIETLNAGEIHIVEPDLAGVLRAAVQQGYFRASLQPEPADVFLIAVPTPFKGDHEPDLSFVEAAARSIAPYLQKGSLVILESTSPVGTTEKMVTWLAQARSDLSFPAPGGAPADVSVAYCPERVLPGRVLHELVANDRVIGGMTSACAERAIDFYKLFVDGQCLATAARTAEMAKLTENAFRDVNIAFANELSLICDRLDINVWELIKLANHHPRVNVLQPGPGVGGHCIAVDPWFIVHSAPEQAQLIATARRVNDGKPHAVMDKIRQALGAGGVGRSIAFLGLAFKPDIDDLRESPALEIALHMAQEHAGPVYVAEPHINALPAPLKALGHVRLVTAQDAISAADVVVLLVNHSQFKEVDPGTLQGKALIDTRGLWS
jgi:UDP-N-acetyl-D-mannosaminuronic acid dehydrogenase